MVQRNKIDSNETELSMALEVVGAPGVLPATPVWIGLEPNEYDDFGGENDLLARRPINSSRQRKKGEIVDLEATGGFNQDLTNENSQILISGFMYARAREKPSVLTTEASATGFVVADETLFEVGDIVLAKGFLTPLNNGPFTVTALDAGLHEVQVSGIGGEIPPAGARLTVVGKEFAAGAVSIEIVNGLPTLTGVDLTDLGIGPGEAVFIGGDVATSRFETPDNNGIKRVKSVTADGIAFDKSDEVMVADLGAGKQIRLYSGRVFKNELAEKIVRQTFQFERKMGAPDTAHPEQVQAEYVKGAYPNEFEMKIETADKINVDYSFVALNTDQLTSTEGLKAGTRTMVEEGEMYNTSTDFSRIRLAVLTPGLPAPEPLFEFMTELTLNINNNVSLDKAIGVLGGFDATLGLFEVSVEIEAYFSKMESVIAIKQNKDVTLDCFCTTDNRGFSVDLPLMALGGGLSDVEIDEPVKIPLKSEAATAAKYDPNFNHTLLWTFFDYLPDVA